MENLLIVGAGGLGRMTLEAAREEYNCFFIDDKYEKGFIICDCEVIGNINDLKNLKQKYSYAIIAIGNNKRREELFNELKSYGYVLPIIKHKSTYISNYSKVGDGCILLNNVCIQNGSTLGNGVVITANTEIHHDCEVDDFTLIYSNSTIRTNAHVGKRVKIGSNVTIKNNTIVNDNKEINDGESM